MRYGSPGMHSQLSMRTLTPGQGGGGLLFAIRMSWRGAWTRYEAYALMYPQLAGDPPKGPEPETVLATPMRAMLLPWRDGQAAWPPSGQGECRSLIRCGWPFPSLSCAAVYAPANPPLPTIIRGWPLPEGLASYFPGSRLPGLGRNFPGEFDETTILPTHPLYRGLILDTLLFGAAWFPLLAAPAALQRTLRRRRATAPPARAAAARCRSSLSTNSAGPAARPRSARCAGAPSARLSTSTSLRPAPRPSAHVAPWAGRLARG